MQAVGLTFSCIITRIHMWLRGKFFKSTGIAWYDYKKFWKYVPPCGKNPNEWTTRSWISPTKCNMQSGQSEIMRRVLRSRCGNVRTCQIVQHIAFLPAEIDFDGKALPFVCRWCRCTFWDAPVENCPAIYPWGRTAGALCTFSNRVSLTEFFLFCSHTLNRTHKRISSTKNTL